MHFGLFFCPFMHLSHFLFCINNRFCVWHCTDCRDTTSCRRISSCLKRLFIFQSRISQMHMQINKSWHHKTAFRINHLICCICNMFCHLYNLFFFHKDIIYPLCFTFRIQHMSILNQNFHYVFILSSRFEHKITYYFYSIIETKKMECKIYIPFPFTISIAFSS